jgi:hypothetical protein
MKGDTVAAGSGIPSIKWMSFTYSFPQPWPAGPYPADVGANLDVTAIEPNIPSKSKVLYVLIGVYDPDNDFLEYGVCTGYCYSNGLDTIQYLKIRATQALNGGGGSTNVTLKVTYFYTA